MEKILVFGASSKLAQETIKHFNKEGQHLLLVGSDPKKLDIVKDDQKARNPKVEYSTLRMNALEFERHDELIEKAIDVMGGLDLVFVAHGTLPDQFEIQKDINEVVKEFNINCTSVISIVSSAANYFEEKKSGTIAVISSVAGDRGRQSNYIYGSAKGGVSFFLQGLRNRLFKSNVKVITIKPGMVDTPMTSHMPKGLLFAKADAVGKSIFNAIVSGRDVVYVPGFWKMIMFIIRNIPEGMFKKLSL